MDANYRVRFLEIIGLEQQDNCYLLTCCFHIEGEVSKFTLNIDQFTYENLLKIVKNKDDLKYRLSFTGINNQDKNNYETTVVTYIKNNSIKDQFLCSPEFHATLSHLKSIYNIKDLESFLQSNNLGTIEVTSTQDKIEKKEINRCKPDAKKLVENNILQKNRYILPGVLCIIVFLTMSYYIVGQAKLKPVVSDPVQDSDIEITSKKMDHGQLDASQEEVPSRNIKNPFVVNSSKISRLPKGYVALTFDDGPTKYTKKVVDILVHYNVGGTFFFIGAYIDEFPDYVKYTYDYGFEIGNHSHSHVLLTLLSQEEQQAEIKKTNESIKEILDHEVTLFRPPYGAQNHITDTILQQKNMRSILWNRDPEDWYWQAPTALLNYVIETDSDGAIYLFHERPNTVEALPLIIEYLLEEGLTIVTLI
ncbi:polysaccharide deacetylase family protein [Serpentinicella sp. ANB-PHB4]|uniref:polysaccharide deacetylase family protein n=1 Tax=Serpentinicella sp. ANB-PHB4 TaxID=3074076 RepID=UPI002862CF29|nr:polysaccharide deacetylase family protein [Serpentinicella sp. ANB-PHB4]MDR5658841.1 polysaccharide deacetylase family protein [Serpentinicella sp. ANB-PHB4]